MEYQPRTQSGSGLPEDWVVVGVRVIFAKSDFQAGRVNDQYGEFLLPLPLILMMRCTT